MQWWPDRMTLWNGWLPGRVTNHTVIAEELEGNAIELEGNELKVVELNDGPEEVEQILSTMIKYGEIKDHAIL
jgi:hypothetical protein